MSCLSIFWIKNCRRWSFATLAVLHSINNHHLLPGRMKEKEVGRPKVFSSFCQCTMYDFHNSSYIFENTKPFASFWIWLLCRCKIIQDLPKNVSRIVKIVHSAIIWWSDDVLKSDDKNFSIVNWHDFLPQICRRSIAK